MRILRRAYFAHLFSEARFVQKLALSTTRLLWPLVSMGMAIYCTARAGGMVKARIGKSRITQVIEQIKLARTTMVPPVDYYVFELFLPRNYIRAQEYLLRQETKNGLYNLLKDVSLPREARSVFKDKARFAAVCHKLGLMTVPMIVSFGPGDDVYPADWKDHLPPEDLFVKPRAGKGGRGVEKWLYQQGQWRNNQDLCHSERQLITHLKARGRVDPVIVQPCLRPHPALAEISNNVLTTFRIVTILDAHFKAKALAAAFRMPSRTDSIVDNFHAGGIAAAVDMQTLTLTAATDIGVRAHSGWHEIHPLSGATIKGRTIPFIKEALALACDAHDLIGERAVIGWDVAILESGPCIVEANGFPDLDIIQRTGGGPIGETECGQLMAHHIERCLTLRARGALYEVRGHRFALYNI